MNRDKNQQQSTNRRKPASTIHSANSVSEDLSGFIISDEIPPELIKASTRYEIQEEIGRGGVGIIYRAQDWQLSRQVAIKVLRHELADNSDVISRFVAESKIISSLQHPCIPHIYDCGHCDDGRPFHAMMLIHGRTLYSLLQNHERNRFHTARLLNIFARVCQAVAYTHSNDVLHLDLKPGNIIVGEFGEVHLMDWGLARMHGEIPSEDLAVSHKHVEGTLEYMSPEQARGEPLDQRTDVFCLGAILFEILTGNTIYKGDNRQELHQKASGAKLEQAITQLDRCGANRPLIRLAKSSLETAPNDRPVNATVLAAELSAYQASTLERVQNDMTRFFELSLDLFCIAGLDGYFRRINTNFSRVLGYRDSDLLSRPFIEFVHPADREKTIDVMSALDKGKPVVRFRNRYLAVDGQYLDLEWTAKSIPSEKVIFAVARNVTDLIAEAK